MQPIIAGLGVWTDGAGITHTDEACKRQGPNMVAGQADGWLCSGCVLVEVVPYKFGRVPAERPDRVVYGDWRDGRTRAARRRRATLAGCGD